MDEDTISEQEVVMLIHRDVVHILALVEITDRDNSMIVAIRCVEQIFHPIEVLTGDPPARNPIGEAKTIIRLAIKLIALHLIKYSSHITSDSLTHHFAAMRVSVAPPVAKRHSRLLSKFAHHLRVRV